ncbi:hypothetical protein DDZ18_11770 [Marinicauda salina]|uniref:DUF488 family protein n=1 Tax=Marinicauda salina TaxID=2135793 RepID=A0A2U2BS83_9PROT|nr:DUF488 family protein [Marinicauda salina]PWE16860.1 hypothetical protein DDZ18_11770 [Marinicauda salina]
MSDIRTKRIYAPADASDGTRVLVDRLWPRGISKAKAGVDHWLRDVAPSDDLRKRVHAGEMSFEDFVAAYARELESEPARGALAELRDLAQDGTVTLLFAARDEERNNAAALKRLLEDG